MNKLMRIMFDKPRPVAIARTPQHEQAETLLASLRKRRQKVGIRLDEMAGLSLEKQQVAAEYDALHVEVMACRQTLAPLRAKHLASTRAAFRPALRDAAKRALTSIAEVEAAVGEINCMYAEQRRCGGVHVDLQAAKILAYLVLPLERLAREKGETA